MQAKIDARKTEKAVCSRFCCGFVVSFFRILNFSAVEKFFFCPSAGSPPIETETGR